MMTTRHLARLGLAGASFLLLPAYSCEGGDVNQHGCPDGEACSPDTPNGLVFLGTHPDPLILDLGDVKITAVGGTQHVTLEMGDDGTALALPYRASTGSAFAIADQVDNVVTVRGLEETVDMLWIKDPAGLLYDRLHIVARPVASIEHERTTEDSFEPGAPAQLYAPGSVAYIGLHDWDDDLIVDDSMQIAGVGMTQVAWDMVRVGDVAPGTYSIDVTAAGQRKRFALEVAAAPDRVAPVFAPDRAAAGSTSLACFGGFLGARPMHVPWTFTADNADVAPITLEGCITITPRAPGELAIHARSGALATDLTIPVDPAATRTRRDPAATLPPHLLRRVSLGDPAGER